MTRRALITGVTGQDGSHLADFLLEKGYEVIGMVRRTSTVNFDRIQHIQDRIELAHADLLDEVSLIGVLREARPQEVYNLAAQSFVPTSWRQPVLTGEVTALGVTRVLELNPQYGRGWWVLGLAHYRAGNWQDAVDAFTTSMQRKNLQYKQTWFVLAMAYWRLGDTEQARKWYDASFERGFGEFTSHQQRIEAAALLGIEEK